MPSPTYDDMTIVELQEEIAAIQSIIKKKQKSAKADFLKQCRELAKAQGLDFNEVLGKAPGKKATSNTPKSEPKYQNPDDSAQTWTGKGRKPLWLVEKLDQGNKLESFLI